MKRKRQWRAFAAALLVLCTVAETSAAQSVSIRSGAGTLDNVLQQITEQADVQIVYNTATARRVRVESLNMQNLSVGDVLDKVLAGTGMSYELKEGIYLVKESAQQPARQESIGGTVRDADGRPIMGASVILVGSGYGSTTDARGMFVMQNRSTSSTPRLEVSYMGKQTTTVTWAGTPLNITLHETVISTEQVIVTGIFDRPRESNAGSVTQITPADLQNYRGQNLIQTLGNIDPSINIMADNSLGSNPNAVPQITIRGNSTLPVSVDDYDDTYSNTVNAPLVIMDGFAITLTKLMDYNDEDIQSINILKDAAATAIYGSRGANGVIVIVTKAPAMGRLRISGGANIDLEIPDLSSYNLLGAGELLQLQKQVGIYESDELGAHDRFQAAYERRLKEVLEGVNTDWLHYPVRTGISRRYNLRLEGGDEEFRWSTSLGYNKNVGVMKGSGRDNFTGGVMLLYKYRNVTFKNQLEIGLNKGVESPYGEFRTWASMQPYYNPLDANGHAVQYLPSLYYDIDRNSRTANPLWDAGLGGRNENRYTEIINNFAIDWTIAPGLTLRGQLGLSKKVSSSDLFTPADHSDFMFYESNGNYFGRGAYTIGTGSDQSAKAEVTLSYTKTFAKKHQLYAGVDLSAQEDRGHLYKAAAEGFSNHQDFWGMAGQYATDATPYGTEGLARLAGATGLVNYTFDNRYFADISARLDGSSQFGAKNRFAPFWSVGAGWSIHNEKFLKDSETVNNLRLRVSYGSVGSQNFSPYQALQMYSYYNGDRYLNQSGARLIAMGNEQLKWQVTHEWNAGVDFGLWNDRISGQVDIYVKNTSRLLSSMNLPWASGYKWFVDNVGKVRNSGVEASLLGYVIRNADAGLYWQVGAKVAYNKNEIVQLSDAVKEQSEVLMHTSVNDVNSLFFEGYSQNSIWAVRSLGVDPATGNELFLDRNGNVTDTWNPADKVWCGNADPAWRGTATTMLRWKDWSLNLAFAYNWGGQVYNRTLLDKVEVPNSHINYNNVDRRVLSDRWAKPGDHTFFKAHSNVQTRATSRFVMDDNTLELKTASLQWRIASGKLIDRFKLSSMTVGVNATDLFYFSTVKRERGTIYPFARSVGASLKLVF